MVTLCRQSPWPAQVVYNMGNTVSWIIGSNCEMNSTPVAPPSLRPEALVLFLGLWSTNLAGTLHIGRNWFGPLDELFQNDVTTLKFTPCSVERSCRFWLLTETTKKNNKIVNPCKSLNKKAKSKKFGTDRSYTFVSNHPASNKTFWGAQSLKPSLTDLQVILLSRGHAFFKTYQQKMLGLSLGAGLNWEFWGAHGCTCFFCEFADSMNYNVWFDNMFVFFWALDITHSLDLDLEIVDVHSGFVQRRSKSRKNMFHK